MFDNVWLIPLFPLIGFLINGFFGKKIKNEAVIGAIGTLAIFSVIHCLMHDTHADDRSSAGADESLKK